MSRKKAKISVDAEQLRTTIEMLEYIKDDMKGISTTAGFCLGLAIEELNNLLLVGRTKILQ